MNDNNKMGSEEFTVMSFSSGAHESEELPDIEEESSLQKGYCYIIGFVVLGFYFLVFAIIELSTNFNEIDYEIELKRDGTEYVSADTFVSFNDKTEVLVYLQIEHITQIDYPLIANILEECQGYKTNKEMGKTMSIMNTTLNPDDPAIPCGWYDMYYPEGTLSITDLTSNSTIEVVTSGIGPKDIPDEAYNINLYMQWANLSSERYQNWVSPDAQEKVEKLWGKIYQVFSGSFRFKLTVNDEMPHVDRILIYLDNNEALSGYNHELCYINFFYAVLVFIGALANFLIQKKCTHRKVFKKKPLSTGQQSNEIKIFLNSASSSPGAKFD